MERREILGIILIAVVASTVVTYHLQGVSESPFEILEEKIPERIASGQETTHEISASLVLRRDVESLVLDFDNLANATRRQGGAGGVEEAIEVLVKMLDSVGGTYEKVTIEVEGGEGELYDFSAPFSRLAPKLATLSATTVYSVVEIEGRRTVYRGVSDFQRNRNHSIASISISKNEVPETYLTEQAGEAAAQGKPSVMEAPILGRKEYSSLKEDDRLSIRLVVNSIGVPGHEGMLQALRIYTDAEQVSKGYLIGN
jgi:hypothetical protein